MKGRLLTKNGKYYVVISYQDENGKNKQKWVATGLDEKNNKRAATDMMRNIVAEFENGTMNSQASARISEQKQQHENNADNPLFADYLYEWLEIAKANVQITTYANNKRRVNALPIISAKSKSGSKN